MMQPKKPRSTAAKKTAAKKVAAKKTSAKMGGRGRQGGATKRRMPEFSKPSQETVDAFSGAVERVQGVERKTMFGYPAVFLNGNMLASVFQDRIMIRLSERDRAQALLIEGARLFEPSPGRAMREYVELPRSVVTDASSLGEWLTRGAQHVASLPAKQKKR
jgi:TfoX/Sxy family transcriptional regulator of competence genes